MFDNQKYEPLQKTNSSPKSRADTDAQIKRRPQSRKIGPASREHSYLTSNSIDSDSHHSGNSLLLRSYSRNPRLLVDATSMASTTENELETSNSSVSDGQRQPTSNEDALRGYLADIAEQKTLSLTEQFQHLYHVNDNSLHIAQPNRRTIPVPISAADSGATTPRPLLLCSQESRRVSSGDSQYLQPISSTLDPGQTPGQNNTSLIGTTYFSPSPAHSGVRDTPGEGICETGPSNNDASATEDPFDEDYDLISNEETNEDQVEHDSILDHLCVQDEAEGDYMILIPDFLSSAEPPKLVTTPSKVHLERVVQLRQSVHRYRLEIQNLRALLQDKDQQIFYKIEEYLRELRELVVKRRRHASMDDFNFELASKLFFASQSNRNECGPLIDEISSLEEHLTLEETKLSQAENRLHESFGIPLNESESSQGNRLAKPELVRTHSPTNSERRHVLTNNMTGFAVQDDDADSVASTESSMIFGRHYHPLYIEYQERLGDQDLLYERYAHLLLDKAKLEEEQDNRLRVGLDLQKDDREFLRNFAEITQPLDKELDEVRHDIERLKANCLAQGIIDEDDNYIDDTREDSGSVTPPPPPPPLLAPPTPPTPPQPPEPPAPKLSRPITVTQNAPPSPHPMVLRPITSSYIGSTLGTPLDEKSYQSRINPWLLEKLTASRTELALLTTVLSAMDTEPDLISLLDVLRYWERDGAGSSPPQRPGALDVTTLNRLRHATSIIVGDGFDRALVKALFGLSLCDGGSYARSGETAYLGDAE